MSRHEVEVLWRRQGAPFLDNRYARAHLWRFDGGAEIQASASPHIVPPPLSDPAAVDPEEAFVASLSSCHMLWFLSLAAGRGFLVESYRDRAVGTLGQNPQGKPAITSVVLEPRAIFAGERIPTRPEIEALHHAAHERCFLASSVSAEIHCRPRFEDV